jgi:6-pyruvoyltetrahydropterin/6-carboxytetrahydropterin synthase
MTMSGQRFALRVAKEALKFSAAHFMAYRGFRERLHGHNYTVTVTVEGTLGADGYVVDFGLVKRVTKEICDELDERVLVPMESDVLTVVAGEESVELRCEDGGRFVFPRADVVLMPIAHSSAEELSRYLCRRVSAALATHASGVVSAVEISVAEAPGQAAAYRATL